MDPEKWAGRSRISKLSLSQAEFEAVHDYVEGTFERNDAGELTYMGEGIYGTSAFYTANYTYHILKNCNAWTGKGVRLMGYKTTLWSATPRGVFHFLPQ